MEENKRKYAKFILEGCLKLKKEDKLFIVGIDFIKDFIDIAIEEAQKIGITEIETLISEPDSLKELYMTKSYDEIIKSPLIDITKYNKMALEGYSFMILTSTLPNFYQDVDKEILSKVNAYQMKSISIYRDYQNKGTIKWNISAVPNNLWAYDLFGNSDTTKLWNYIFDICLINEENPILAWEKQINTLKERANYLNRLSIDKLIYHNSLGTDLEIGLPKDYIFQSAEGNNLVNMPTLEVFASPDRLRVNGIVKSSKVLIHNNEAIADFSIIFKDGRITDYSAKKGYDILKGIIETDEGSHYLGECALVDYSSAISKTGIIFKNTLYDENASCHLAIGAGFSECIENGLEKTKEELLESGINYSHTHVDFFIGTSDLEVKAVLKNGKEVVIMKEGNFIQEDIV